MRASYSLSFTFLTIVGERKKTTHSKKTNQLRRRIEEPSQFPAMTSQVLDFSREVPDVSMAVLVETTLGDLVIDLFTEERPKSKKALLLFTLQHTIPSICR